jgi:hypothetical protein
LSIADTNGNTYGDDHTDSYGNRHRYFHIYTYCYSDSNFNGYRHGYSYTDVNCNSERNSYANCASYTYSKVCADSATSPHASASPVDLVIAPASSKATQMEGRAPRAFRLTQAFM